MNLHDGGDKPALVKKTIDTIRRYDMLHKGDKVLAGVSGGADSSSLLHFLCSLREQWNIKVYAAHINHGLRGEEALRDEDFVRGMCGELGVELFVLHARVAEEASENGESVEEAGRRLRYDFFARTSEKLDAVTATAHTLSDSIETSLFNYARGTGIRGLCGIHPKRSGIIRPLINCTRSEIEEYCEKCGIIYVNDSTNFTRDYARNRIRLDMIPQFYALNPSFDKAAKRLMDGLAEDDECLAGLARVRLASAVKAPGVYRIAALTDGGCPQAVLKRCAAFAALSFSGIAQEAWHIEKIAEITRKGAGKCQIRGGGYAEAAGGMLKFSHFSDKPVGSENFTFDFLPGMYKNDKFSIKISEMSENGLKNLKNFNKTYFKNAVDCDKIIGSAVLRSRLPGDKIHPAGRNATKSLKKLYNEARIPPEERCMIPVAADSQGIIWVLGAGADERCAVSGGTKRAYILEVKNLEG